MIQTLRPLCFFIFLVTIASLLLERCTLKTRETSVTDRVKSAKPWVFWYWMQASVSREGITADLEAMKEAGIGGAYLMPIKGPAEPPLMDPPVVQLSPEWWEMVKHAMKEADRLELELGMHASDGFALAGGPWITPELSMQKVVWTETIANSNSDFNRILPQPETNENYYKDIAVLAFPTPANLGEQHPVRSEITTSTGEDAGFLAEKTNTKTFRSSDSCWIQFAFEAPFTCRSITIRTSGNNYQAHRLQLEVSDDGKRFRSIGRLEPPRHGWQDGDADVTHTIEPVTARFFRFVYNKTGSEPGAEDLDAAKWKPSLKIKGIELSAAPKLHQFEGKTGKVWRISRRTTSMQLPDELCVKKENILDITEHLDANGRLSWHVPEGNWTILRVGHTSTGHTNYTGGGGLGLECDKFNPEAVRLQFENWFGKAIENAGPELASRVLRVFHVDSWECGSQNWSPVFRDEFKNRRGYDLYNYLPVMAGIPVESADISERFLHDVRQTIAELVHDNFYGTLAELAHEKGCTFTAESVAPTMTSDGMLHYDLVDVPMGEFWLRSPTHDKPNDMLDAISGAHVYGKQIVQAEAFTELRMAWDEHPGMLKTLGDRNFAQGINRLAYHVFTHNPWLERKPGMTLDGVGLYFQRNQTWWQQGRAWVEYARRCQTLLQQGKPVVDIAVFTGEEVPRRAILPDRLVPTLPGIFGKTRVEEEKRRRANEGLPLRELPDGVTHSANIADPADWIDPMRGYAYDSFNKDALMRLASVRKGRIELPGGASYKILVLPLSRPMAPHGNIMSPEVAAKILELVKEGATVVLGEMPVHSPGLEDYPENDSRLKALSEQLWGGVFEEKENLLIKEIGKGKVIKGPYLAESFDALGIMPDVVLKETSGEPATGIAWTHRTAEDKEIYFIANQQELQRTLSLSLRVDGRIPELYDPVTGEQWDASKWEFENGRTILPVRLEANGSLFVILQKKTKNNESKEGKNWVDAEVVKTIEGSWEVTFDPAYGGPKEPVAFGALSDWSKHEDFNVRHYSGTAVYSKSFKWDALEGNTKVWLNLGEVANIAEVKVNDERCGIAWTHPFRIEITNALKEGENQLTIEVANTWANRLIGDQLLPEDQRITKTTAPYRLQGKPLLEAGLLGPVNICIVKN